MSSLPSICLKRCVARKELRRVLSETERRCGVGRSFCGRCRSGSQDTASDNGPYALIPRGYANSRLGFLKLMVFRILQASHCFVQISGRVPQRFQLFILILDTLRWKRPGGQANQDQRNLQRFFRTNRVQQAKAVWTRPPLEKVRCDFGSAGKRIFLGAFHLWSWGAIPLQPCPALPLGPSIPEQQGERDDI